MQSCMQSCTHINTHPNKHTFTHTHIHLCMKVTKLAGHYFSRTNTSEIAQLNMRHVYDT
jgi:hypothetical protein